MTRICNFPISKTKRCKQPITDDKPNCGRHRANLSADQFGQNPTVYGKNGELHIWAGKPDGLYCLIHGDPAYQVLCQLAGEVPPCCLRKNAEWKDADGELHRDDGPAVITPMGGQFWYQHGEVHRDDGPAWTQLDGTQRWYQHGELHRDDGPAVIWSDGKQEWRQRGELHREDGPAEVRPDGTQEWWQHGKLHRDDGPAMVRPDGTQEWYWHGEWITEQEHAWLREQSKDV
jgi:hypothetical protein